MRSFAIRAPWARVENAHLVIGGLVAVGLAGVALFPLFYPGFFHTHAGLLPAYLALDDGSGGKTASLAYRVLGLLQRTGLGATGALKMLHGGALLLGAAGAYLAGAQLRAGRAGAADTAWMGGLLAALVFTLMPYRLAAVYVRGDVAESLALGFTPFMFLGVFATGSPSRRRTLIALGVLAAVATTLSHIGIGLGVAAIVLAAGWAMHRMTWAAVITGTALALTLRAAVLGELVGPPPSLDFAQPAYLFLAQWGYGETPIRGLPIQLGLVAVGLALLALLFPTPPASRLRWALAGSVGACAVFSFTVAGPAWGLLGWLFVQPWQTLGVAVAPLALLASSLALPRPASGTVAALALIIMLASYPFLQPIFLPALDRQTPVLRPFGDRIMLLGYAVEPPRDGVLTVQLDWQALADGREDVTVFVQVLNAGGQLVAQRDQPPFNGRRPTSGWARGEVIRDRYAIDLPANLPAGEYALITGLYRPADGTRLTSLSPSGQPEDNVRLADVRLP